MPQETTYRYGGIDPAVYLTRTAMRADPDFMGPSDGPAIAILSGGDVAFDLTPSGVYLWNGASVAGDNGTSIIQNTHQATGRWIRIAS